MEHQKILNLLNESNDFRRFWNENLKWSIVNNQSDANCDVGKEIIYNREVSKYNPCEYHDA